MTWSLGEIEALSRKAARGSGLSWGLAEEAGRAARWLCAAGLPGADCLASLLQRNDGAAYETLCPAETDGPWAAAGGTLCPLITGAALSDRAAELAAGQDITLARTAFPLLLYPYMAGAADETGAALSLGWPGARLTRANGTTFLDQHGDDSVLCTVEAENIPVGPALRNARGRAVPRAWRGQITPETAGILQGFAHRIHAPDTPESRLSGAGAGLTDND
ncbi:MAG: DUF3726 domain-containing protein [Roseovarius sp.]|nr:DUF3726 domain-containing protein [Roseovarius sp.]